MYDEIIAYIFIKLKEEKRLKKKLKEKPNATVIRYQKWKITFKQEMNTANLKEKKNIVENVRNWKRK